MPAHLTMLWQTLSARLRHDPEIMALRIDHLEGRVSVLETKPEPEQPQTLDTPMGKLPVPLVILVVLWLIIYKPETVLKFLGL